ncbi:hypothetical protein [Sphingobacterium humi]|uniref:Uncharacterized protein n=1 Tax=Sphingobacterium humi TaxID=1796905 RepID=A0A6N8KY69_9SPHI|nr:hypothetical protein [Sphingobacterium humi]MVZ60532.1 hypothetical protein [Sphingobacterium humi]
MLRSKQQSVLQQFTQKKFCAVFIDRNTLQPIKNLPVYGELVLTTISGINELNLESKYLRGKLSDLKVDLNQQQINKLMTAMNQYLTMNYGEVSETDFISIMDAYAVEIASHLKSGGKFTKQGLDDLIKKIMDELISNEKIEPPHVVDNKKENRIVCPFGYLATDHVGYLSYDIEEIIKQYRNLESIADNNEFSKYQQSSVSEINVQYWLYPNGNMSEAINVSEMGRISAEYVFGNSILTQDAEQKVSQVPYQSLQKPDLIDWYLSPSSFSVNPRYMIGEDGCERIFPANFATSEFRFFQIIRGEEVSTSYENGNGEQRPLIRHGFAYEYQSSWQPLGHTLGQIIYSLPLAPGEVIKLGIIEWKRNSEDTRTEDTAESEDLTHNTFRDRNILETVKGAISEWQRGGNVMGGNSGGAGVSFGIPMFGAAAGNAHSFGGGYSTSTGDRDLTVSTVQQVSDAFAQHSTAIRELRSTVIIQSDQQEYARAETRVVANNNHSHALTMLYYEVLRHYKITTQFTRRRNVLLIDYPSLSFNYYYDIWKYKQILLQFIRDESLKASFDVIERFMGLYLLELQKPAAVAPPDPVNYLFGTLDIVITTGQDGDFGDVRIDCLLKDGTFMNICYPFSADNNDKTKLDISNHDDHEPGAPDKYLGCVFTGQSVTVKYGDIEEFIISYRGIRNGVGGWDLAHLKISGFISGNGEIGKEIILLDLPLARRMSPSEPNEPAKNIHDYGDRSPVRLKIIQPVSPPPLPQRDDNMAAYNQLGLEEKILGEKLKAHLLQYVDYYSRLIWLNEDMNDRARRFEQINIGNDKLIDLIENRPIDILGNYVVFPSSYAPADNSLDNNEMDLYFNKKAKSEKLMTLPSRGVFAEAKLGNCNASEVIDNTRFWDWQQSPIMEKAPDIESISTASRNVTQNLTPTPFPQSIVNIVNPAALPDPTAMSGALNLLGKSEIFRDMSMSAEVNDLLKKLSDNSVSFAEAANQARGILKKQEEGNGSSNGTSNTQGNSGNGNNSGNSSANAEPARPTAEQKESQEINNAEKKLDLAKGHLTPKQQQEVREKVKDDLVKDPKSIYITLHTNDGGSVVHVAVPADYDINQEYQGKLPFVGGTATAKTKIKTGTFHIKAEGKIPSFEGQEYIRKLPGYSSPNGVYYLETSCNFDFKGENAIALNGTITLSEPVEVVLYADINGKISSEFNGGIEFPVEIAKVSLGSKIAATVGGQAGFKLTYKVYSITGILLKQQ